MADFKALKSAVEALPPQDLAEFRRWFAEFDLAAWDDKIEGDVAAGKLDALSAEAEADVAAGESKSLLPAAAGEFRR